MSALHVEQQRSLAVVSRCARRYTRRMFIEESDFQRADWALLQNGAVNLFWSRDVLEDARLALIELRYDVSEISFGRRAPGFHEQMSQALKWEQQFGYSFWNGNLDALDDAMQSYPFGPTGRSALVFDSFHRFVAQSPDTAHQVLHIIETAARDHLLCGRFLIALVQTDDARYSCPPIGCRTPMWNRREWSNADRGL